MQALFKNIKEDFNKYNIISKYLIKFGTITLICLFALALTVKAYLLFINADCTLQLIYEDILECFKESFGAIYLSAFILEIIHIKVN